MTKQLKIYNSYVLFEARDFANRLIFADSFTDEAEARAYGDEKFAHCVWLVDSYGKKSLNYEVIDTDEKIILVKDKTRVTVNKRDGVDFYLDFFRERLSKASHIKSRYEQQYKMLKNYKEKYEQTK